MARTKLFDREVTTDILAVGGGGAGIMAAVTSSEALPAGGKVTLVAKGSAGRSGNTILAAAGISMDGPSAVSYGFDADPSFTKDVWFEEIVKQGFYLSEQPMVEKYVDTAAPLVKQIIDWGTEAGFYFHFVRPAGFFTSGKAIGMALRHGLSKHPEIEVIEDVYITDVVIYDGRAVGAIGIDVYTGEVILFRARAVILGTGGFQPFSFACTVSDMTGDGIGMALRAGCAIADMEFPLHIPGVCLSPAIHRGSIFTAIYNTVSHTIPQVIPPRFLNAQDEDIEKKIPPALSKIARETGWVKLIYTYFWGKEITEGRGSSNGGIYFSFDHASREALAEGFETLGNMLSLWYKKPLTYQGEDVSDLCDQALGRNAWEVGLCHEYSNGGIVVDENGATEIPGLYAAGEVSSGCFGAYRSYRALVEMLIQGASAGRHAAHYIGDAGVPHADEDQIASSIERITAVFQRSEGIQPAVIRKAMEEVADRGFNYTRDEASISSALRAIEKIKSEMLPHMTVKSKTRPYNREWIDALGVENLLLCLEAGLLAADMRKESRGTHIRSDHERVDHDAFLVRIHQRLVEGKLTPTPKKPAVTSIALPSGGSENVMEYILSLTPEIPGGR
jgi:succinate dehydrogenase / fumarate reductase flavoprotein subunit